MMKRGLSILLILGLLLFCPVGCGSQVEEEPELRYSDLVEPVLDVSIPALISAAELDQIMGEDAAMELLGVYEEGTQAVYRSQTDAGTVRLHIQRMGQAEFEQMMAEFPEERELLEDIGTAAWWYGALELFAYQDGYVLEVIVTVPGAYVPRDETVAIAQTVLGRLRDAGV